MTELEKYEVVFRDQHTGNEWSCMYTVRSFAEAEDRAYDGAGADPDEIVRITKDYDPTLHANG